jgi:hypothetical protein
MPISFFLADIDYRCEDRKKAGESTNDIGAIKHPQSP